MIKEFELTKNSGSEEIKKYFQKILELSKSGEKYPISLDDVWGLAYSQKRDAVRLLQGEQFIQDIDFTACQNGKVVNINSLANGIRSEINISVSCMEYLVARKVRSVFEVYRQVFHKIAEERWVLPKNFSQALRLAADQYEQIEAQNKQIEALSDEVVELKKKTDYLEIILQSKETVTIGQIAADYGMTPQEMNGLLAKMHIQHKVNGQWLLYADYVRKGYTHSETIPITHKDGRTEVKMFSKWRQSGRIFLYNKLKERGIIPLIEKVKAMSEEKFNVGDLVVLSEKGKTLFGELSDSDMPMRITNGKDGIYWCLLKDGKKTMYLNASHIEPFHDEDDKKPVSCKEIEFAKLTKQILETFKKKNADYGDSTTQTFKEFGLTSYAIRLNDKLNRIKSFCKKGELEVNDESVVDTLMDMASYCLLAVIDIKNQKE